MRLHWCVEGYSREAVIPLLFCFGIYCNNNTQTSYLIKKREEIDKKLKLVTSFPLEVEASTAESRVLRM